MNRSVWTMAEPANVMTSDGDLIVSALDNPEPHCGCKDLILAGAVKEEKGKEFVCMDDDIVNDHGDTVITEDNDCLLLCDKTVEYELFCAMGKWTVDGLVSAADISCKADPDITTVLPLDPVTVGP